MALDKMMRAREARLYAIRNQEGAWLCTTGLVQYCFTLDDETMTTACLQLATEWAEKYDGTVVEFVETRSR